MAVKFCLLVAVSAADDRKTMKSNN